MLIDVENVNQVSPTSGYAILSKTHGMFYIQVGGGCGGRREGRLRKMGACLEDKAGKRGAHTGEMQEGDNIGVRKPRMHTDD